MGEKKYRFLYVLIPIIMMIGILTLHTNTNVKKLAKPASENWSHSVDVDLLKHSKQPYLQLEDGNLEVFYQKKDGLHKASFEQASIQSNKVINTEETNFKDNESFQMYDNLVFWEKYHILYTGQLVDNKLVPMTFTQSDVESYDFIKNNEKSYLIVSAKSGLFVYEFKNDRFSLVSSNLDYPKAKYIKGIVTSNNIEIYSLAIFNYNTLQYYRTNLNLDNMKWNPVDLLSEKFRSESMFEVANPNFVPTKDTIKVYMIVQTRFKNEKFDNIEWISFDRKTGEVLVPQKIIPNPVYNNHPTVDTENLIYVDTVDGNDIFTVSALSLRGRERSNIKIVELSINNGIVNNYDFISLGSSFSKDPYYLSTEKGDYIAWLDLVQGGYQLKVSSQEPLFLQQANKMMEGRWLLAFGYTFQNMWIIVLSFIKGMLWLLAPLILLVITSLASPEWAERRYKYIVIFSIILYVIFQLFDMDYFYRPQLISYMPWWLTFTGARYIIPLLISGLLILPTWGFMKKVDLPSPYATFFYFVLTQLVIINLVYSPYIIL